MRLRYTQLRRLPPQAKASQACSGAIRPMEVPDRAPGWAMARRTKRTQPSARPERPEHVFEALCALQLVCSVACGNCSEKNRLVQNYELRSALTIIRLVSLREGAAASSQHQPCRNGS